MNFLLLTELTPKKGARPDSETDSGHNDTLPSSSARSEDATSSLYDNPQPSTSGMGTRKSNNSSSSISIVSRVNVLTNFMTLKILPTALSCFHLLILSFLMLQMFRFKCLPRVLSKSHFSMSAIISCLLTIPSSIL